MEQLNRIEVRGSVGTVNFQVFQESKVAHFTVATNYAYKDRNGNPVIETTWHNVTAWEGKNMPDLSKIEKGTRIYVCGRFKTQKYAGPNGEDKYVSEIVANKVSFVSEEENLQVEMNS